MSEPIGPGPQRKVIANIAVSIDGFTAAGPEDGMGGSTGAVGLHYRRP